jgi:hypothetical protein
MHYASRTPGVRDLSVSRVPNKGGSSAEEVVLLFNNTRLLLVMLLCLSRNDLIQTNNLNPPPSLTQGTDWLTPFGRDDTNHNRCDVLVVNLAAAQGATN